MAASLLSPPLNKDPEPPLPTQVQGWDTDDSPQPDGWHAWDTEEQWTVHL